MRIGVLPNNFCTSCSQCLCSNLIANSLSWQQCTFDWGFASSISAKCSTLVIEQLYEKAETKAIDGSQCRTTLHIGELTSEDKI